MVSADGIIEQKKALRLEMKGRRAALNEVERARAAWALCLQLEAWLETRTERTVGVYLARPYEISLDSLIETLLRRDYLVACPRVDLERGEMSFWRLENLEEVEIGPWNVREPHPIQLVGNIPLIFVPGLAFDSQGGRLGTGGGWYDRYLGQTPTVVGTCFDCLILPQVPLEPHDRRVDFVASEKRLVEARSQRSEARTTAKAYDS